MSIGGQVRWLILWAIGMQINFTSLISDASKRSDEAAAAAKKALSVTSPARVVKEVLQQGVET